MNKKEHSSLWARFSELEEKGLNAPGLTEEDRLVVQELQETLEKLARGAQPFLKLQDAADASGNAFLIELAKFNCRMAFISGRTSDEVCRLVGMFRDNADTVQKQFELAKQSASRNNSDSAQANKKANWAIGIAIVSVFVSIALGVFFGCLAHLDSSDTTEKIVTAIESLKGSLK